MATCSRCFKDWIACGIDQILVMGTLAANASYIWTIENRGAKYQGVATTDDKGHFIIEATDLPAALLNPYAGSFVFSVVADDAYQCNSYTWNDSAYCEPYDCIEFDVVPGSAFKNTLGCDCPEEI